MIFGHGRKIAFFGMKLWVCGSKNSKLTVWCMFQQPLVWICKTKLCENRDLGNICDFFPKDA